MNFKLLLIILMVVIVSLSADLRAEEAIELKEDVVTETYCTDPRPEICQMIYMPVCGTLNDGSHKTYSNSCVACSDKDVNSWVMTECKTVAINPNQKLDTE